MIMPMVWHCNECNFDFNTAMVDTKADKMYCPYCVSRRIEKR